MLDLVRAVRNIFEHWFDARYRRPEHDPEHEPDAAALAVQVLTGWGEAEMRRGLGSVDAREMRAAAVSHYFLGPGRFPGRCRRTPHPSYAAKMGRGFISTCRLDTGPARTRVETILRPPLKQPNRHFVVRAVRRAPPRV